MNRLMTTKEILEVLGVSRETLRLMMRATPDGHEAVPWLSIGTPGRPVYRWRGGDVLLRWAADTRGWRESVVKSAGPMAPPPEPHELPEIATRSPDAGELRLRPSRSKLAAFAVKSKGGSVD
tara:strand:- start:2289 stop:2654 length:366 start_codon:yes stop_codon:yes gene_type:complete